MISSTNVGECMFIGPLPPMFIPGICMSPMPCMSSFFVYCCDRAETAANENTNNAIQDRARIRCIELSSQRSRERSPATHKYIGVPAVLRGLCVEPCRNPAKGLQHRGHRDHRDKDFSTERNRSRCGGSN